MNAYCPACDEQYPTDLKCGDKCPYCSWVSAGCDTCGKLGMYCEGETCSSCIMMPYKIAKAGSRVCYKCDACDNKTCATRVDAGDYNFCVECYDRLTGKGLIIRRADEVEEGDEDDLFAELLAMADNESETADYDWECQCGNRGGYNDDHMEVNDEDDCFTTFYCVDCRTNMLSLIHI